MDESAASHEQPYVLIIQAVLDSLDISRGEQAFYPTTHPGEICEK